MQNEGVRNRKGQGASVKETLTKETDLNPTLKQQKATRSATVVSDGNELVNSGSWGRILMPLALLAFMAAAVTALALIHKDISNAIKDFVDSLQQQQTDPRLLKVVQREIKL